MEPLSVNAAGLIRELIRNRGVTRLDLQSALNVSGPTVTRTILELAALGIVDGKVNGAGAKGRPAETVDLARHGLCSIAVTIRAGRASVNLVDARGNRAVGRILAVTEHTEYAEAVSLIGNAVLDMVQEAAKRFRSLAGVGVSFGGSADYATGSITTPSAFQGWRGKALARDLEFYTGLPCAIDNYSFALVGALNWFDPGKRSDFFLVVADYGVAGVSSIGGGAYLGPARQAGGFGHIGSRAHGRVACHCGGYDCLTALNSAKAIAARAQEMGLAGDDAPDLAELIARLDASPDPAAATLLREAGQRIAATALDLCRGLGFPVCVFGGVLFDESETARTAAEAAFSAPGHNCEPRFLCRLLVERPPDDLAATSVAYQLLSDRRQIYTPGAGQGGEAIRLRQHT